ncbi:MAG: hypothetical protein E7C49_00210 [Clostridium sp.]|nr:hypothetical protein [Clostridium sp.]
MKPINDAIGLLNSSKKMLVEIETLYKPAVYDDELSFDLKVKIKNFLENIRSCLDYTANYTFDIHCKSNYSEKELKNNKIYFPIFDGQSYFQKNIKNRFKGLELDSPIVNLWDKYQLYNDIKWPKQLSKLTNKNKHIELIKNSRTESATIKHMQFGGITFENCTFENGKHTICIDGKPLSIKDFNNNPLIKNFNGHIKANYTFGETNTPIIETLEEILNGATTYLTEFITIISKQ